MAHNKLKLANSYKPVTAKNDKIKAIILILCTQLIYEFDKIELDNRIFTGALKFAVKNLKILLEKMLDRYYLTDGSEDIFNSADAINEGSELLENWFLMAFSLEKMPRKDQVKHQKKIQTLANSIINQAI